MPDISPAMKEVYVDINLRPIGPRGTSTENSEHQQLVYPAMVCIIYTTIEFLMSVYAKCTTSHRKWLPW